MDQRKFDIGPPSSYHDNILRAVLEIKIDVNRKKCRHANVFVDIHYVGDEIPATLVPARIYDAPGAVVFDQFLQRLSLQFVYLFSVHTGIEICQSFHHGLVLVRK